MAAGQLRTPLFIAEATTTQVLLLLLLVLLLLLLGLLLRCLLLLGLLARIKPWQQWGRHVVLRMLHTVAVLVLAPFRELCSAVLVTEENAAVQPMAPQ